MTNTDNSDQIHRFIFDDADIRGEITTLKASYQEACAHQNLPPTAQALLGDFLAAASLLSEILKFTGTITIQARGNGKIPLIMAETTDQRNLRGIAKVSEQYSSEDLEGLNLAELIGNGVLTLTMDPEKGQRYQGIVELSGGTLAECLTMYFTQSEQLPTRLWLYSNQQQAGGILLQALPKQASGEEHTEERWDTAVQLTNTATAEELYALEHKALLGRLFNHEFTIRIFDTKPIQFHCHCSQERCAYTVTSLGKEDAFALLQEQGSIEINCEFCGNHYAFDETQLKDIFEQADLKQQERKNKLH